MIAAAMLAPSATRSLLDPNDVRRLVPSTAEGPDIWVHVYRDDATGWRLSVATHAAPGSEKLSLGGFRIAPESRTSVPGFDPDREAIELAAGMEEKVYWSRVLRVGGPRGLRALAQIVGGKCVLLPTPDARVGQPRDRTLLDFAVACLRDIEATAGIHIATGQDLGHGLLSDRSTTSLAYMHERFAGSVLADTSRPTAEGNWHLLHGMLDGVGLGVAGRRIALLGAGNIGRHVLAQVVRHGGRPLVLEPQAAVRAQLEAEGIDAWPVERKQELLAADVDAVVVNAAGGSLDAASVRTIADNPHVRVVCGSENLAMPDPANEAVLLRAGKVYCHPELGGMMGYLTAVEQYLARRDDAPFDIETLMVASARLYEIGREGARRVVRSAYGETFQDAVRAIFG